MSYSYPGVQPDVIGAAGRPPRKVEFRPDDRVAASAPARQQPADGPRPRLIAGKPYSEWSEKEVNDALMWRLGPRFRAGLRPPPEPQYYIPPVPGSASDPVNSHKGSMAWDGRFQ